MCFKIIFCLFSIFIFISCYGDDVKLNVPGLTKELYTKVSGVWDWIIRTPETRTSEMEFSWGKSDAIVNVSIIIDLGAENAYVLTGGSGEFLINKIETTDSKEVILYVQNRNDNQEKSGQIILHFFNDIKMMWIESNLAKNYFEFSGYDNIYHKAGGPK